MNARDMKVVYGLVSNIASLCATLMDVLATSMPTDPPDAGSDASDGGKKPEDVIDKIQAASERLGGELPAMLGRHRNPRTDPGSAPAPVQVDPPTGTVATGAKDSPATD